ncbi:MAG: SET domain-containing protein [Parcubacteria group bacterium]|jgi:hypothetical protein
MMSKVYTSKTKKLGNGLFAKTDIKKNEIIFIVKGTLEKCPYSPKDSQKGQNWLAIEKNIWLAPLDNNPWVNINHSCTPNVGLKGHVTVVAMRNIKKSEQLTIDYSTTEDDPNWKMKCNCEQNNCRKIIRSARFLSPKLFKKYKNYIPQFLKRERAIANNADEFVK